MRRFLLSLEPKLLISNTRYLTRRAPGSSPDAPTKSFQRLTSGQIVNETPRATNRRPHVVRRSMGMLIVLASPAADQDIGYPRRSTARAHSARASSFDPRHATRRRALRPRKFGGLFIHYDDADARRPPAEEGSEKLTRINPCDRRFGVACVAHVEPRCQAMDN